MKNPKENSLRWLDQAEHNLEVAQKNLEVLHFYSDACFMAEQAGQMALKAFLLFNKERYILIHSVAELAESALKYDSDFNQLVKYGRKLDQYYIPTRYPDALTPPAVPYKTYSQEDAQEAVRFAEEILRLVKSKIRD